MDDRIRIESVDDLVQVHVTGKLTREAYKEFVPILEEGIRRHGKLRVLFEMRDFHGWTAGALWDDLKFDLKHFGDIKLLAIVGEKKWQQGMATFCKPFTKAKIQYFPIEEREAALRWLNEQPARAATSGR